jgi:hypothetical protein
MKRHKIITAFVLEVLIERGLFQKDKEIVSNDEFRSRNNSSKKLTLLIQT